MTVPGVAAGRHDRVLIGLALAGAIGVSLVLMVALADPALRGTVGRLALLVSSLSAALASAWKSLSGSGHRGAWRSFALAGTLACAGYALGLAEETRSASWFLSLAFLALAVGMGARLHAAWHRVQPMEAWLESALVVGVASVLVLRFSADSAVFAASPALYTSIGLVGALLLGMLQSAAAGAVVNRLLTVATACLALAVLPSTLKGSACCDAASAMSQFAVAGWLLLSFAALARTAWEASPRSWHHRQIMAPVGALVLSFVLVHSLLAHPLRGTAALAMAVLGFLIALRVAHLLHGTHFQTDVRHELAQSNALIEVSQALAGVSDLDATLTTVTRLTMQSLGADGSAILLLCDGGHSVELSAHEGLPPYAGALRFPVERSFAARVMSTGEPRNMVSPRYESAIRPEELALTGQAPFAMAPLLCRADAIGALCCVRESVLSQAELELFGALADHAALAIQNAQLFEQVNAVSLTDPLTGLANRRQLERDLGREFAAARRGRRLVAVMLDLNDFKRYNDQHGHLAGDQVLRVLADILASETRAMNLAGRYGGDEFVALLTDTDALGGEVFVERIRSRLAEASSALGQATFTVSAGIAEYTPEMSNPAHLLAAADLALYASKGRRSRT